MSTVGRRTALGLVSLVVAVSGAVALGGTASAIGVHKSTQCPSGYQLNPNNTQECTPVGSPSDSQSSVPPGSQSTDQP
ncbi:hypothetical protein [Pseudonocardia spinosispora]|uniref:hypothetical protein n=1 Tax=Pseudonocardia spinosispora TaxID=103441 RepID=UPI0003F5F005|nr:hypothetical protein [Pseudonocardia spinosispora]